MDLRLRFNILLGGMIKYEARLVVLGNEEDPTDQDFFSPTCNHKALVIVLALAADENVKLSSLDIKGFFLTAKIEEPAAEKHDQPRPPCAFSLLKTEEDPIWITQIAEALKQDE